MPWSIERRVSSGFAVALIGLSTIGGLAYWSTNQLIKTARWVEHTHQVITHLESLLAQLSSAEAGQRGYIITDNEPYLETYHLSTHSITATVQEIRELTRDNATQQERLQRLAPALKRRLTLLDEVLTAKEQGGFAAAQRLIEQDVGRELTSDILQTINAMLEEEHKLLALRLEQSQLTARNTLLVVGLGGLLAFVLVPLVGFTINRDVRQRKQVEVKLQENEHALKQWVGELEQHRGEIMQLGELSDMLQACFTLEEAYAVSGELVQRLFPHTAGGIFMINDSKTLVETVAIWGEHPSIATLFGPAECWSLRRGRAYFLADGQSSLRCHHVQSPFPEQTLCVPMMAQGEALGIIHLVATETEQLSQAKQLLATTVAEHVAIALANLKLRETLKNQSIRDPLTGLFNRRYMEESIEREMRRSERSGQPLGIIMLDVDHFKRFNDTFGHEAGDVVLRELGQFLKSMVRGSDIACRYGGEEFMLLLPEASIDITHQRAELIRNGMKHLTLEYRRQALGMVTLSLGAASFPEHGSTLEAVIRAADAALYKAKHQGRDQVVVA
jgi:diguanylate cyclase (GGDEF)-like protein